MCTSGYAPNNAGVCLPCLSNCRVCSGQANGICLSCGQGFYLSASQTCQTCPQFCQSCTPAGCTVCNTGYTLLANFTCQLTCQTPCLSCLSNPTICTSCLTGYEFDQINNICVANGTCNGACQICPFNFVLSNSTCVACKNSQCARCLVDSLNTCTSCLDGLYLNLDGACLTCPTGCGTCSNPSNCLTCSSGYTAVAQPVSTIINCVACQSPCAQCSSSPIICTQCVSGYYLNGWKCVATLNFGFNITLNVNLTTFYSNYQGFLNGILSLVSSTSLPTITLNSITQGSVIVAGNINVQQNTASNSVNNQYNSLTQGFSQGSTIATMPITSSTIVVNGGSITPDDGGNGGSSGPNLAIILGVTIPVGILLIAIIGYCIFNKTRKSPPNS